VRKSRENPLEKNLSIVIRFVVYALLYLHTCTKGRMLCHPSFGTLSMMMPLWISLWLDQPLLVATRRRDIEIAEPKEYAPNGRHKISVPVYCLFEPLALCLAYSTGRYHGWATPCTSHHKIDNNNNYLGKDTNQVWQISLFGACRVVVVLLHWLVDCFVPLSRIQVSSNTQKK
jgi:hypothetical protein